MATIRPATEEYAPPSTSTAGDCDPCTSGYSVAADSNGNAWLTGLDVSGSQSPAVLVDGGAYSSVAGLIVATA